METYKDKSGKTRCVRCRSIIKYCLCIYEGTLPSVIGAKKQTYTEKKNKEFLKKFKY